MPEAPTAKPAPASGYAPRAHHEARKFIEHVTASAEEVQRRVLTEILEQNAPSKYLRRYSIPASPDAVDAFRRLVPLVTYEGLQSDILRIANGDTSSILSGMQPERRVLAVPWHPRAQSALQPERHPAPCARSALHSRSTPSAPHLRPAPCTPGARRPAPLMPGALHSRPSPCAPRARRSLCPAPRTPERRGLDAGRPWSGAWTGSEPKQGGGRAMERVPAGRSRCGRDGRPGQASPRRS